MSGDPGETYLRIAKGEEAGEWYDTVELPGKPSSSACIRVLTKNGLPEPAGETTPAPETTDARTGEGPAPSGRFPLWLIPAAAVLAAGAVAAALIAAKKKKAKR